LNIAAIMRIPDQATRNFAYAQALEIDALKAEIEALKAKPPNMGLRLKGGVETLEIAFRKVT
jgi:hypothetical protein